MASNQDLAFKMNVARQALQLDQNPSLDKALAFHRHALAEVDSLVTNQGSAAGPQVKAMNTPSPLPKTGAKAPCKYFLSEKGCRKPKCSFAHDMSGLDKATRSRKCLRCGSESHRAKECPVAKGQKRGDCTDPGSPGPSSPGPSSSSNPVSLAALSGQVPTGSMQGAVAQVPSGFMQGAAQVRPGDRAFRLHARCSPGNARCSPGRSGEHLLSTKYCRRPQTVLALAQRSWTR